MFLFTHKAISDLYLLFSIKVTNFADWTGVKICLNYCIESYNFSLSFYSFLLVDFI
jgi:hypothetical protein